MPFCAICTTDLPSRHLRLAPLGRADAMVNVCDACFDEKPRATCGARASYVPPEESVGPGGTIRDMFIRGAQIAVPDYAARARLDLEISMMPMYHGVEEGHLLVRIPRDENGRRRDQRMAFERATALYPDQPIAAIGYSARYFLFQRPDPACLAKAKQQREDHRDPLASLHAMQRHGARR